MYRLKIILRYLWARRITVIPVLAVAVAVFLLTVVLSVMGGFSAFIESRMRGLASDLIVEYEDARGYADYRAIEERICTTEGVAAVSAHVEGKAVLTLYTRDGRAFTQPVEFIGVDFDAEGRVSDIAAMLAAPWTSSRVEAPWPADDNVPGLVMGGQVFGRETFYTMGYHASLTTPTATDEDSSMRFRVTNILRSGLHEQDSSLVYVPLGAAQQLMRMGDRIMSFHVRKERDADLHAVRDRLAAVVPKEGFVVKTWIDANQLMIDAMKMERVIWTVILSAMLAVAGFCIMAVMSLTVIQKTRDIGILRSIGASVGGMMSLFVQYGLVVGLIGASLGLAGGVATLTYLDGIESFIYRLTDWTPWPRGVFYFGSIPRQMNWPMFWTFWAGGIVVSFLASLVPAARAARTDPVTTLRYE